MAGRNRVQLGTFGTDLAPGITFTRIPGALTTGWPRVRELARTADRMGSSTSRVGTAEQIADRLERMAAIGIDGCLLGWPLWEVGMARFEAEVMPLPERRGLRGPAPGHS